MQENYPKKSGNGAEARDTLFDTAAPAESFQFNEQVAAVFDDMLNRSVPFYREVISMTAGILAQTLTPGDTVYDLGCSTGTTLFHLAALDRDADFRFVGVDNSPAMLAKAKEKAAKLSLADRVSFIEADITAADLKGAGAVIVNYTLQFIEAARRPAFLKTVYKGLRPGAILVLSEKVVSRKGEIDAHFQEAYYRYKKERGYSELEIANKREALENVLVPLSIGENREMLRAAGFREVETFFQWFNFVSFIACR
jgi:tRNA (cmo5U34)-methyltransferase